MSTETDNESDDILMRLEDNNGVTLTIMTAPAETFGEDNQNLEPMITGWSKDVYAIFNEDEVSEAIQNAIDLNGELYGENAAAFLPIALVMEKAMTAAKEYIGQFDL